MVGAKRLWASRGSIQGAIRGQVDSDLYSPISVVEEEQAPLKPDSEEGIGASSRSPRSRLLMEEPSSTSGTADGTLERRLYVGETARLSFEFCILWVWSSNLMKQYNPS